jgi:hypothetical protein
LKEGVAVSALTFVLSRAHTLDEVEYLISIYRSPEGFLASGNVSSVLTRNGFLSRALTWMLHSTSAKHCWNSTMPITTRR